MIQLESDLRMAAELGQHLLKRHDDYVVEVQKERQGFLIDIERQSNFAKLVDELETNNRLLELQNEQTMRENLTLLKRLEDLNSSLNIADTRNHELRTNLLDAETTVGRLSHRATKAQGLEAQIATAELEREVLERDVAALSVNSHQSDVRYRKAEKRIQALQRQLDTIAIEVPELKQQSVLSRAVEETTLKAPSNISRSDVLEDHSVLETVDSLVLSNTSLEYNNAELQRVLASAQDEVVMLREKLASHERTRSTSSMIDNDRVPRKSISQELHQHNHYHYHIKKPLSKRDSLNKETPTARSRSATDPRQTKSTASTASHGRLKDRVREPEPVRTPIKTKTQLGMVSPPSTKKRNRDSGYFSFASESGRERSTSLTCPVSPCSEMFADMIQTSTPLLRKHLRSSSHESIFVLQNNMLSPLPHAEGKKDLSPLPPVTSTPSKQDLISLELDSSRTNHPVLRHSTSHESVLDTSEFSPARQTYPSKIDALRRPYPSPLQNAASSATVSVTSATAYNSRSDSNVMASPRGKSYTALRSAAAAQKLSPSTTTSAPPAATAQFWKRNSDKTVPSVMRPARTSSSRWTSLVPRWASGGDQGSAAPAQVVGKPPAEAASIDHGMTARRQRLEQGPAVSLSGVEEALLREALDL